MDESAHTLMLRIFIDIPDPRIGRTLDHALHDILTITVCAVLSGLEHWVRIADYGCRVRVDNAAENVARVRRLALMLLKNEKTAKMGVKPWARHGPA